MTLSLQEIFIAHSNKHMYKKQDLFSLKVSPAFLNNMGEQLNLNYLEGDSLDGNICFANNSDVRPEFRTNFSKLDIVRYVSSFLTKTTFSLEKEKIPFPKNSAAFWNIVKSSN